METVMELLIVFFMFAVIAASDLVWGNKFYPNQRLWLVRILSILSMIACLVWCFCMVTRGIIDDSVPLPRL